MSPISVRKKRLPEDEEVEGKEVVVVDSGILGKKKNEKQETRVLCYSKTRPRIVC